MLKIIALLKQKSWANIFTIYLRFLIGAAFVFSSVVKAQAQRFIGYDGSSFPINSMPHFFETLYQSGIYWQFIGLSQLLAGFLLLTQRFATLGALIFYPIILNIFFITISYDFHGTPIVTGLMLLANTYLLLWDYHKFKPLLLNKCTATNHGNEDTNNPIETLNLWIVAGTFLFAASLLFRILDINPKYWFWTCTLIGFAAYIAFLIKLKQFKKLKEN